MYYKEATDGQILEEGITEAGSMGSFIAAGSAYAAYGINTIPFFIYYSMFGFQRIADFIWAAADMRTRGFLLGGTAGRTTLSGEGLQHQDGNSHVLALSVPNLRAYDPAFAYEIAVIIQDGIRRMYKDGEDIFYYITLMNEPYAMPDMPSGKDVKDGILKGMYKFRASKNKKAEATRRSFSAAARSCAKLCRRRKFWKQNTTSPPTSGASPATKTSTPTATRPNAGTACIPVRSSASRTSPRRLATRPAFLSPRRTILKTLPNMISKWLPRRLASLGTDGFGRSEGRQSSAHVLRSRRALIALATLHELHLDGKIETKVLDKAIKDLGINPEKPNPVIS